MKLLKKIKQIWKSKYQIIEGITNRYITKEHIELVAKARMDVCNACPLLDRTGAKCIIPGTGICCGQCGCVTSFTTRSLSYSCPHPDGPRWKAVTSEEQENKIYERLNYNPDDNI